LRALIYFFLLYYYTNPLDASGLLLTTIIVLLVWWFFSTHMRSGYLLLEISLFLAPSLRRAHAIQQDQFYLSFIFKPLHDFPNYVE